jgi:hypothetical protein
MNPSMQTIVNSFKLGNDLFLKGIATLDDAAASRQVVDNTNPPRWLAGHMLMSRWHLLSLFTDAEELPWASKFAGKFDPAVDYPTMSELKNAWVTVSDALFAQMSQATDDHFSQAIDWKLPNNDKTVRGACMFLCYHEAWHLGQIAYARKGMGMEGLVPY